MSIRNEKTATGELVHDSRFHRAAVGSDPSAATFRTGREDAARHDARDTLKPAPLRLDRRGCVVAYSGSLAGEARGTRRGTKKG